VTRIRVAYVPASLRPGGAERQMMALAERLPRDRFEVDFLSIVGQGSYDERAIAGGARVRALGTPSGPEDSVLQKGLKRITKIGAFVTAVRKARYDVVDAWLYPSDVMAAFARPFTRTPVVIAGRRNVDPRNQFGPLERLVGAATNRLIDAVVANSAAAAALAIETQGVSPDRMHIIRNGVIVPDRATPADRAARRAELGASDGDVLVGCVANYRDVKGLDRVVAAVARLIREGLPLRLELVGEGDTRPQLERQIRDLGMVDRICLHGGVLDVEPLYGAFDIVVQGSLREGLPNVLLEAGAAGCAIVATSAGGSAEIVIDGRTGLLVPVADDDALVIALRCVATDPALRERLGAAARAHIETAFGMDRFVAEFASLYETLVAARTSREARAARGGSAPT
jgi:glycosyltransferase involved in cell wall biosynthesis